MKNSSKIAVVAGLGVIAGGVAGYYLNSDKGRTQRQKAADTVKEQSAKAASFVGDMKNTVSNVANKAQNVVATAFGKAEQAKEYIADSVETFKSKTENVVGTNGHKGVNV